MVFKQLFFGFLLAFGGAIGGARASNDMSTCIASCVSAAMSPCNYSPPPVLVPSVSPPPVSKPKPPPPKTKPPPPIDDSYFEPPGEYEEVTSPPGYFPDDESPPPPVAKASPPPKSVKQSPPPPMDEEYGSPPGYFPDDESPPPPVAKASPPPKSALQSPPPPMDEEYGSPPGYFPDDESPPPPSGGSGGNKQMTTGFPLGKCQMGGPSIPYEFVYDTFKAGRLCWTIRLAEDYQQKCKERSLTGQCTKILKSLNKIVFWYKHTQECGYNLTKNKKHLQVFPWRVFKNTNIIVASTYQLYSRNSSKAHAAGNVALLKYVWKKDVNIEVQINRSGSFVRGIDESAEGYRLCLTYNSNAIDVPYCISNSVGNMKYSFADSYQSICTTGLTWIP